MLDPITGEVMVIAPGHSFKSVTEKISRIVLTTHTPVGWFLGFLVAGGIVMLLLTCLTWLFLKGVGIWGLDIPVGWGFAIVNFVWWIGIGHAGTLISAILLLFKQTWRNSINRFAEAMTIFAVVCAGMFPADPRWPPLVGILALSLSQFNEYLAAVPVAAPVGRFRGFDLRHHLGRVLVHRHDPRSRNTARSCEVARGPVLLRSAVAWLARFGTALDAV